MNNIERDGLPFSRIDLDRIFETEAKNIVNVNDDSKEVVKKSDKPKVRKTTRTTRHKRVKNNDAEQKPALRVIPLGGIGEIGKNMTLYEYGDEAIVIDCGMSFPDDELLGIDIVIPDFTYAVSIKDKIKGIFITHAHEDHIGALPYFLKEVNAPIYGTSLTIGLIKSKLEEHSMSDVCSYSVLEAGYTVKLNSFTVEAIHVNHSIPGAVAFSIGTEYGTIVHTGDFKIDFTPVIDFTTDLGRFGEIGSKGVLALFSDSTNAEKPGLSKTEAAVSKTFGELFNRAEGKRVIIATFSSNIYRIQQIINLAKSHGRKIAFSGRSMENYTRVAAELGYLEYDPELIVDIDSINKCKPSELIIITTGSQGEPMSALSRMAAGSHKHVSITDNDFIIISATPIPGNEKDVSRVVNQLLKLGSEVIYESMYDVHASGHACSGEHKLMINIIKPKYFIPIHGEFKHLKKHADTALSVGVDEKNIFIPEIGEVLEFTNTGLRRGERVASGRVLVDGLGVGDVGSVVLRDRKRLGEDGIILVICGFDSETKELLSGPEIISRGFIYTKDSDDFMNEAADIAYDVIVDYQKRRGSLYALKTLVKDALSEFAYQRTKRNPMVLPVFVEL